MSKLEMVERRRFLTGLGALSIAGISCRLGLAAPPVPQGNEVFDIRRTVSGFAAGLCPYE